MTSRTLDRILIANRGEIALRVVRTVRDLGGASILPYTPEDLLSPAAELADEARALPEGSSYTDAEAVLAMARATGADAVHPGYGFLSENDVFAQAVADAGIVWVGPSPSAMRALGDKMSARATAERAGVDPVPGITESVADAETVISFADAHGYPVALKRTDGGGGRGSSLPHGTWRPSAPATGTARSPSCPLGIAVCSAATRSFSRRPPPPTCPRAFTIGSSRPPGVCSRPSITSGSRPASSC